LTTSTERFVILCGKSWGVWGGFASACNILALVPHTRVYEPICDRELEACFKSVAARPTVAHALSLIDAACEAPVTDCANQIDGGVWLVAPDRHRTDVAVVSYGYATTLVKQTTAELGIPHLHCIALRPELSTDDLEVLASYPILVSLEYNAVDGGFGQSLRARYGLACQMHGLRRDIDLCVHSMQLEQQEMSVRHLRSVLVNLLERDAR
jgi:transketolase